MLLTTACVKKQGHVKALARDDGRRGGHHFIKGSPLTYRERLEALWAANPGLSAIEAARLTGASRSVACTVKRRLQAAGVLP